MPPNNTFVYHTKDVTKFFRYFMKYPGELPKGAMVKYPSAYTCAQ